MEEKEFGAPHDLPGIHHSPSGLNYGRTRPYPRLQYLLYSRRQLH
jgi:hypothetical protein